MHAYVHACTKYQGQIQGRVIGFSRPPPQPYQGIPKTDVLV